MYSQKYPLHRSLFCICIALITFVTTVLSSDSLSAQNNQSLQKTYNTHSVGIDQEEPRIDGVLDDPIWQTLDWSGDFSVWEPENGAVPKANTKIKLTYTNNHLYFAAYCFDNSPDSLVSRLNQRDGFDGDRITLVLDSYNDKRTAFSFTIMLSGVQGDEYVTNNGDNWDSSWNPIWYSATKQVEDGYIVELKIPLSQLRFGAQKEQSWGMQIFRHDFRHGEVSQWKQIAINSPNFLGEFGRLEGIKNIKPKRQVEIMPYTVLSRKNEPVDSDNPLNDGSTNTFDMGLDAKVGLTNDIIMDVTVNPDFGQVEADPSQVNLSNFEIFFQERRPFFIESNNITDFRAVRAETGGSFNRNNLFYSRRIGRGPQYYPDLEDGEFTDRPFSTNILTALKVTGKTKNGLSLGVIDAVTKEEKATISNGINKRHEIIEPATNYLVARVQQDFDQGNTGLGAMLTATNRSNTSNTSFLHDEAYTGGIDFFHQWNNRMWRLDAKMIFSQVKGSTESITRTQESFVHNYQRPDAKNLSVDTTATSLSGMGGSLTLGMYGNGRWSFQTGVNASSPGLELNDIGYQRSANQINQFTWLGYRFIKPFSIFNSLRLNLNQWNDFDAAGNKIYEGYNFNTHMNFKNFWYFSFGTGFDLKMKPLASLRGGPAFQYADIYYQWFNLSTDTRKNLAFYFGGNRGTNLDANGNNYGLYASVAYRPSSRLQTEIETSYDKNKDPFQYITTKEFNSDKRYILGQVDQHTISTSIRLNYTINPKINITFWGQPFFGKGKYSNFKRVTDYDAKSLSNRYENIQSNQIVYDQAEDEYNVDENKDNNTDYTIGNPNFKIGEFLTNFVIRYEYKRGSDIYLVWSQNRSGNLENGNFTTSNMYRQLNRIEPTNIFLIKFSYRFIR